MAAPPLRGVLESLGRDPAAALDRLLCHEMPVAASDLADRYGAAVLDGLAAAGLVRRDAGVAVPLVRVDAVGPLRLVSDLRHHRRHREFVVGPGPASFLLARHVRPAAGGHALDLGTGSGIQALLLASAGMTVRAIDINPRALAFTGFNAALNGLRAIEPASGDFLAATPDRALDGRFDVVVANPPFVLTPAHELVYRDRTLPRDQVTRRTVDRVGRALARGGRGYVLGNWIDTGGHWSLPVRTWLAAAGSNGMAIRVADHSPATYAAAWTKDLPAEARPGAIATWAADLEAEGIRRIHIGLVALGRPGASPGPTRFKALDGRSDAVTLGAIDAAVDEAPEPAAA